MIFIVFYTNFDGLDEFHSAHSTKEKAQERIDCYSEFDRTSFRIELYNLDEEAE